VRVEVEVPDCAVPTVEAVEDGMGELGQCRWRGVLRVRIRISPRLADKSKSRKYLG